MREILFRGKRKDNGKWISGYLFLVWETAYICWGTTNGIPNMEEVIPETVGQFVGADDKNRRKIFEGDIVERGDRIWVIEYDVKCAQFVMKTFTERGVFWIRAFDLIPSEWCEIIGNKFDNPELKKWWTK